MEPMRARLIGLFTLSMMNNFLFVFLDDSTLDVVDPDSNVVGAYEGVDVASGEYAFFDSQLRKMIPTFTTPNKEGSVLGLHWVISGKYLLEPAEVSKHEFFDRLNKTFEVNRNGWFDSVEAVKEYSLKRV